MSAYNVKKEDKNIIYYGEGEHELGDIYLQSGQTLFIDEGAVVYATVYGMHAENIKILGRGILDNSKNQAKILSEMNAEGNASAVANAQREHAVNFVCCKNVEIDGITIRDAGLYNIDAMACENIHITVNCVAPFTRSVMIPLASVAALTANERGRIRVENEGILGMIFNSTSSSVSIERKFTSSVCPICL